MMIEESLKKFRMLPEGWHYGEGRAATDEACATTLRLYNSFEPQYHLYEVFPRIDGGVLLSCYTIERTVTDFDIEPDGTYFEHEKEGY